MKRCLVLGAGGFIGHHVAKHLKAEGHRVVGADLKRPEYEPSPADEFVLADLRRPDEAVAPFLVCSNGDDIDEVYQFAADMGGMGYVTGRDAQIIHGNALINLNVLDLARHFRVGGYLFSSSACVYPKTLQCGPAVPLREDMAFPADTGDGGYGWEKLYAELCCHYYREQHGLNTKVVRFHNVYGPLGTYQGGKEKAPAALCRKVALAKDGSTIEVWGDGTQERSFCYVDDAVDGVLRLMRSPHHGPFNIGTDEVITVNDFARLIVGVSGKRLEIVNVPGATGVHGRNSDTTLAREMLGFEARTPLRVGIEKTYYWIERQLKVAAGTRTDS